MTIKNIRERSIWYDGVDENGGRCKRWKSLWYDEVDGSYYVCSSVKDDKFRLDETLVFPSNEKGDVISYTELSAYKPAVWTMEEAEKMVQKVTHDPADLR